MLPDKENKDANTLRVLAFYLPQFHPIPENDRWWGEGFTEWTNVRKATPRYEGHYQPHVPSTLGYYDLRDQQIRQKQADMARQYGIDGFCYYHYWFNGHRLLELPFNEVLASGQPDFPFCLCWANENWTRRWDGLDQEILIQQNYNEADDREHIRWLVTAMLDPRYIRIEGKPLLIIYRVRDLPDPVRTAEIWREEARNLGVGEIYLCRAQSSIEYKNPSFIGFDATVEFQPTWDIAGLQIYDPGEAKTHVYDYNTLVANSLNRTPPEYIQFPCVVPSWDNTARKKTDAYVLEGANPDMYQYWLRETIRKKKQRPGPNLVFINGWNEWGEGNHLEPDEKFGFGWLEATRRAVLDLDSENFKNYDTFLTSLYYLSRQSKIQYEEVRNWALHLQADLDAQTASVLELQSIITFLNEQKEAQDAFIAQLESSISTLQKELIEQKNRQDEYSTRLNQDIEKLNRELSKAKINQNGLEEEIVHNRKYIAELENSLEATQKSIKHRTRQVMERYISRRNSNHNQL